MVHQNGAPIWRLHTKLYKGAMFIFVTSSSFKKLENPNTQNIIDPGTFFMHESAKIFAFPFK